MRSRVQTPKNTNYADNEEKILQEIFSIVHDVPSNMDLIRRLKLHSRRVFSLGGKIIGYRIIYLIFFIGVIR